MKILRLLMNIQFYSIALCLLLLSTLCHSSSLRESSFNRGRQRVKLPRLPPLGKSIVDSQKGALNGSACAVRPASSIRAPKKNVWAGLTNKEYKDVEDWLYQQKELNLTQSYSQRRNRLQTMDLMLPNKTDVLNYIDGNGVEPVRYARATLFIAGTRDDTFNDVLVGPLPVGNETSWEPLGYPYTRRSGSIRDSYSNTHEVFAWMYEHEKAVQDIIQYLWPNLRNGSTSFQGSEPFLQSEDGMLAIWNGLWNDAAGRYEDESLLPLNLYYGVEWKFADPDSKKFLGWLYNDKLYPTTEAFRAAYTNGSLKRFPANIAGDWSQSGHRGAVLSLDTRPPPQAVAPAGARFSVDKAAHYVSWMDNSFYMGFTPNRGWALYDVRQKGQRILYELSLQEALAHYAGSDPEQSTTSYLDASLGLGDAIVELVPGYDCPAYATYMDTRLQNVGEPVYIVKNSVCFFEFDADHPMARHSNFPVSSSTKNIFFVVRSVYTVGNYDYMFSYEFYLDGSIKVNVRASGYIHGAYYAGNEDYGYKIHDALSGSTHDHVLNFKADFDILGTSNTVQTVSFVPAAEKYIWSAKPRNTFKLKREFVESEDTSRLNWDRATQYRIVNTDQPNEWGEFRGYRISPADGTTHFTNSKSSNLANCIHPFTFDLAITKQKDTEPQSAHPNDSEDIWKPMINFDDFFDGESLMQEDLVVWFNLGMHHLPHTGDLPNTVMTTAHAGIQIVPSNYYLDDISTETLSQLQLNFGESFNVSKVKTFGQQEAFCSIDLSKQAPDLYEYQLPEY